MQTVAEHTGTVKPKHVVGLTQEALGFYNKKGGGIPYLSPVFIDKLAVAFEINDIWQEGAILETWFYDTDKGNTLFADRGLFPGKRSKTSAKVSLHAPNPPGSVEGPWRKDSPAHLAMGGHTFGRLEYNPSNWTPHQMSHMQIQLERILHLKPNVSCEVDDYAHGDLTLGQVSGLGSATRLHVTVDLFGYAFDELAWWDVSKQGQAYIKDKSRGEDKAPGKTLYIGPYASKTANKFCIYDKAAYERKKYAKDKASCALIPDKWIRVEACINNPNIRVECLNILKNPFKSLRCAHIASAFKQASYPPPDNRGPYGLSLARAGVPDTLASIANPLLRNKLKVALDASTPPCWDIKELWVGWPAALVKTIPSVFPSDKPALH